VIVVVGPDGKSVRVFEAYLDSKECVPEFHRDAEGEKGRAANAEREIFTDSITGSGWNFKGCAVRGQAAGQCLKAVPAMQDYWFDWQLYHPRTTVHGR
jgi:hypothetical protein